MPEELSPMYVTPENVAEVEKKAEKALTVPSEKKDKLANEANQLVDNLFSLNMGNAQNKISITSKIENLGDDVMKKASSQCTLLKVRVGDLSKLNSKDDASNVVVTDLATLSHEMKKLDPSKIDFDEKGLFGKVSRKIKSYFEKYQTADKVLAKIFESLEANKKRLENDNKTLMIKQADLYNATLALKEMIEYVSYLSSTLDDRITLAEANGEDTEIVDYIKKNISFVVLQKIQDLQQQMVICQNGYVAMEILIQNNKELIRNVKRAQTTSRAALEIGVMVAAALFHQKVVLRQVGILNQTTNYFIGETSRLLREQGTAIQQQSIEMGPSYETMVEAFENCFGALDDLDTYRAEAIPLLRERIEQFRQLTDSAESRMKQIEANH